MNDQQTLKPTALIIDDDYVIRVAVEDYLLEAGFHVVCAADGEAGLVEFPQCDPDIVLLDVTMPGIDGYEVCRRLRSCERGRHVPILMMTGRDDIASVDLAYESGATDFAGKPINFPLLTHRLRYLLRAKQTSDQLRVSEAMLAKAQRIAKLGSWHLDLSTKQFECTTQVQQLFAKCGMSAPFTLPKMLALLSELDREIADSKFRAALEKGRSYDIDFSLTALDGKLIHVHQETEFERNASGRVTRALGTFQDVTEQREAESKIREIAFFDNVTGLPNRALFKQRLSELLAVAKRESSILVVMFVDLDQFKRVNDSWGHHVGDELLRQVSRRLRDSLRGCDIVACMDEGIGTTLARLGGDEFVILLPQLRHTEDAARVARRLLDTLKAPFLVENMEVIVSGSIGISSFPDDGVDEETLLKHADIAMYRVKEEGRNGFRFYAPDMNARSRERLHLEAELRRALENNEFVLHYQPKIDYSTGIVVGAEALVRWMRPDIGLVAPGEFIGAAEECGLIVPLGKWVLEQAAEQAALWQATSDYALQISVNISAEQIRSTELINTVATAIDNANLAPELLQLELTESTMMSNSDQHIAVLDAIRAMGISISIDDFGTGYSSLAYLKRLPIDGLKIDRCFVVDMTTDTRDAAIVQGTIMLAHSLGLKVVAEGVESQQQDEMLRGFGCDMVQGNYYSPAIAVPDFTKWMEKSFATRSVEAVV